MPSNLPVPDAVGIYGFPDDLIRAHDQWQRELRESESDNELIEIIAPETGYSLRIRRRAPQGNRVTVAIEPHNDDLVLSAGGALLRDPKPLIVITVFSQSDDVHPSSRFAGGSLERISNLRNRETDASLMPLNATHYPLDFKDSSKPYGRIESRKYNEIVTAIGEVLSTVAPASGYDLIAPAGVTRHPDHLAIYEAATQFGCRTFWDDTAFYPTYAASFDDRHLFELRVGNRFTPRYVDITESVLDKLTLLYMYESQMQPKSEMYRVIRYNWTVASAASTTGGTFRGVYAERFFEVIEAGARDYCRP